MRELYVDESEVSPTLLQTPTHSGGKGDEGSARDAKEGARFLCSRVPCTGVLAAGYSPVLYYK